MPGAAYQLTRAVGLDECSWLDRTVERDEVVWPFYGCTYGAISPSGVAVSDVQGEYPFYELPRDALRVVGVD